MNAVWSHPQKRNALIRFIAACAYSLFLCWACWFIPEPKFSWFCLLVSSFCFACAFGYRAFFFSNDWYRAQEYKEAIWWYNHPRLDRAISVILLLLIAIAIWRTFHK